VDKWYLIWFHATEYATLPVQTDGPSRWSAATAVPLDRCSAAPCSSVSQSTTLSI